MGENKISLFDSVSELVGQGWAAAVLDVISGEKQQKLTVAMPVTLRPLLMCCPGSRLRGWPEVPRVHGGQETRTAVRGLPRPEGPW